MLDEIDVPPNMFTPSETPILPAGMVTTTPFETPFYPTQWAANPTLGLAGELRGSYANNHWNPKWSSFMYERTPSNKHGGVDIYAPRGTPIVAIVSGEVEHRKATDGNKMGNRVHLRFKHANVAYRFILGHLDRFAGAEGSFVKGTVLGYAGCSGNAADSQPCLTPNVCGKYSTHLHLQLARDADSMKLDPLKALGWKLDYAEDLRDVLCHQV
jgi:murein DD-endopeptidase MepM/ murein hydrolase activator NlpD